MRRKRVCDEILSSLDHKFNDLYKTTIGNETRNFMSAKMPQHRTVTSWLL